MAKYKPKLNWGIFYPNDLYYSTAYQSLTLPARNLLHCLMSEVDLRKILTNKRGKQVIYPNNGQVCVTQSQFTSHFSCVKTTYQNARNQLIKTGCIKMTYRGGRGHGDHSTYKVLTLIYVQKDHQRWKQYPDKNWKHEIPKSRNQLVGVATQFQKGKSGRKPKNTLLKHTLNSVNRPIELDSLLE